MKKLLFIAGAGIGYVLGTRAGREQYNRMKAQAREFLDKPMVKEATETARVEATRLYDEGRSKVQEKLRSRRAETNGSDLTSGSESAVGHPTSAPTVTLPPPPSKPDLP